MVYHSFELWCLLIGAVLLSMAMLSTRIERLPLTTSIIYLFLGVALGPSLGTTFLRFDPVESAGFLHRLSEVVVILSLFTAGLKMSATLTLRHWRLPLLLATVGMVITVALIAATGFYFLNLPLGAAILLGGILAPTDPVLASDVQVRHPRDRDALRFSLTGEAGFNDGAAFPFVMLGLGLMGIGKEPFSWTHWLTIDVLWATFAGLAIGGALGAGIGRFVLYLRSSHKEAVGLDNFLTLGLIAFSYGLSLKVGAYGFLAVFAAGIALRQIERSFAMRKASGNQVEVAAPAKETKSVDALSGADAAQSTESQSTESLSTDPAHAPAFLARMMLEFNENLDRIGEIVMVILVGVMLTQALFTPVLWWFIPLLFLAIRPLSVLIATFGVRKIKYAPDEQLLRKYLAWFGVRGIGSLYYLAYAIDHGISRDLAQTLASLVIWVIAISILVHGISVTPFMNRYESKSE